MKFGGTSVGTPKAINQIIKIVSSSKQPVGGVVVSAFSGVTNLLIESANRACNRDKGYETDFNEIAARHIAAINVLITDEALLKISMTEIRGILSELKDVLYGIYLLKELSPKILDTIMNYGERMSAYIIAQSFENAGITAEFIDARKLIKTDDTFGSARVDIPRTYKNISSYFEKSESSLKVVTGFVGSTKNNETTTLGRGGSDYTASLFGAAINAAKIEIWTDVDGVLTADPRKVPTAFTIDKMTYQEAIEMSHFGAKVIYPQTMLPALTNKVPLVIRNTFNPSFAGTVINAETSNKYAIKGISSIGNVSLALIQGSGMRGTPGIAARLFGVLAQKNINIAFITQASSEYTICFAIDTKYVSLAKEIIQEEFKHEINDRLIDKPIIEDKLLIIAVVGEKMRNAIGVAGQLFTTLAHAKSNVVAIAQGSSERNISVVIQQKDEVKALNAIHKTFFEK